MKTTKSNIKKEMKTESDNLRFEKAQELKELLDYINITLKKQKVEIKDNDITFFIKSKGFLLFLRRKTAVFSGICA